MTPESGTKAPANALKNVVLPAPLGPTIPMASFDRISKLTFFNTETAPKFLIIPSASKPSDLLGAISFSHSFYELYRRKTLSTGTFLSVAFSVIT